MIKRLFEERDYYKKSYHFSRNKIFKHIKN